MRHGIFAATGLGVAFLLVSCSGSGDKPEEARATLPCTLLAEQKKDLIEFLKTK